MRKSTHVVVLAAFLLNSALSYAEEYRQFDIKYGMHERTINSKYGQPLLIKGKKRSDPIPWKKALYKVDKKFYMILYFFSGRLYKITLLEDMTLQEATGIFKKD